MDTEHHLPMFYSWKLSSARWVYISMSSLPENEILAQKPLKEIPNFLLQDSTRSPQYTRWWTKSYYQMVKTDYDWGRIKEWLIIFYYANKIKKKCKYIALQAIRRRISKRGYSFLSCNEWTLGHGPISIFCHKIKPN